MNIIKIILSVQFLLIISCNSEVNNLPAHNVLSEDEIKDSWQLLFDGKSLDKWRDFKKSNIESGWIVDNGKLVALGKGADTNGDIITKEEFSNFDLKLEWNISKGGNSGIFYGVQEGGFEIAYQSGPEYQLIDDINFPEKLEEWQKCGADYAMYPANNKKKLKEIGEWNSSEIIVKDSLVQYWLNDEKIVEFKRWTQDWKRRVSEGKWKDYPSYGIFKEGHIGLQDHGYKISFRDIKIKKL